MSRSIESPAGVDAGEGRFSEANALRYEGCSRQGRMEKGAVLRCALGASALLALGCKQQEVESTDVRTSGVYPEIEITATGSGSSRVEVRLKVGGPASNTFLDLQGSDTLKATFGGVTKTLDASARTYSATFPTDAEGDFVIAFLRGPDDDSAPSTIVKLPAPFTLGLGATEASRASQDVAVTWDPPGSANMGF